MGWPRCHPDDWHQRHHIPHVHRPSVVHCRLMGTAHDTSDRSLCHGHLTIGHILLYLHRHIVHTHLGGSLRYDLQCRLWLLVGPNPMAVPARDPTSEHSSEGCKFEYCNELGVQLAGRRNDAHTARVDTMAPVPSTRILLRCVVRCW